MIIIMMNGLLLLYQHYLDYECSYITIKNY